MCDVAFHTAPPIGGLSCFLIDFIEVVVLRQLGGSCLQNTYWPKCVKSSRSEAIGLHLVETDT